jgi:hypothetical protein
MKRVLEALPVLVIGIVVAAPSLSEVDRGATKKPAIRDGPRLGSTRSAADSDVARPDATHTSEGGGLNYRPA